MASQKSPLVQAISDFAQLFKCFLCSKLIQDPHSITECGHSFCRECIIPRLGIHCACPKCGMEARVKNCKRDPSKNNLVSYIKEISTFLPDIFISFQDSSSMSFVTNNDEYTKKCEKRKSVACTTGTTTTHTNNGPAQQRRRRKSNI